MERKETEFLYAPFAVGIGKNDSERTNGPSNPFIKGFEGYSKAYESTSSGDVLLVKR